MNTAIYVRVSTQQQAEHGYSLETQIDACRKKAMELGAVSIKIYTDDGYSGAYLERPAHEPKKDGLYHYYQCNAVSQKDRSCKNHSVSSDVVDTMVWEKLKSVCRNETMLKRYIQQNQPKQKDNTEAIKKELDAIETKRQAIMNWFSANLISAEESTQKLQALKKQEQNLTEKLVTKKEDIPTDEIVKDAKKKITFEEKRNFILQHIKKVIILRHDFEDVHDIDLEITIIFRCDMVYTLSMPMHKV